MTEQEKRQHYGDFTRDESERLKRQRESICRYDIRKSKRKSIVIAALVLFIIADLIASYGIYDENQSLKAKNEQLVKDKNASEKKWNDFNKSFVPETALPRLNIFKKEQA